MPLAAVGQKILTQFIQQYGEKKGTSVFYAKENKSKAFARLIKRRGKK